VTIGIARQAPTQVTRVLVVDDSVVVRQLVGRALKSEVGLELAAIAPNGRVAMEMLTQVQPDIVILDLEMPEMNGFETLRALRRSHPKLPVIIYSHLSAGGATATLEALTLGASDFALKPSANGIGMAVEQVRSELVPLIRALAPHVIDTVPLTNPCNTEQLRGVSAVLVATSTGGPSALAVVLTKLPANFQVPILIVQHMPPIFTATLAQRLDARCPLSVVEAAAGDTVMPGTVYIAPGGHHLEVVRRDGNVRTVIHDGPKVNSCRPAADVLFGSAADVYGSGTLAVVLTGMGRDGLRGAEDVRARGGSVIVESETTAVVSAMPNAVASAGLAYKVIPIDKVANELERRVSPRGPT
jgi:two-component system chemotaxis response regulator CheB